MTDGATTLDEGWAEQRRRRLGALRSEAVGALPGVALVGVFLAWAASSGGYFPHAWLSGGLFIAALILVLAIARFGDLSPPAPQTAVALAALLGFAVWNALAIAWSEVRGDAWEGANRTALYLLVFALFALWRWTPPGGAALLVIFSVGVCVIGIVSLLTAAVADDVGAYFNRARFAAPVGYPNGNAALFLLAFWPSALLASRREIPPMLRPLLLAVATVLLQLAVLAQSRGGYAAFAAVLVLMLVLAPDRVRLLVVLAPPAALMALTHARLVEVSAADTPAQLAAGARSALSVIAAGAAAVLVVGIVIVWIDARVRLPSRAGRILGRGLAAGALAALTVAAVLAVVLADPVSRLSSAWEEFRAPPSRSAERAALDRGLSGNRSDLWRVAVEEFRERPLVGAGPDNFTVAYVRERRGYEETLYPHSFPLQVLSQTGLVGGVLILLTFLGAGIAAIRVRMRTSGLGAAVATACVVVFAYWLAHASIDWLWELPALTAPALAFLAMAGSIATGRPARPTPEVTVLLAVISLLALLSFVPSWLAVRETRYAAAVWRADPAEAASALERARRLNPLTDRPDLAAGSIARRRGDWQGMAQAYSRALERNPHSWYAHLQLALAQAMRGNREAARASLTVARDLNPNESILLLVSGWLDRNEPVDVDEVTRIFSERHSLRTRGSTG